MKYKFVYKDVDGAKVIKTFEAVTLTQVLDGFQSFLKAAGFVFNGEVDIINDDYSPVEYDLGVTEILKND